VPKETILHFGLFTYRRVNGLHCFFGHGPLYGICVAHRSLLKIVKDVPAILWLKHRAAIKGEPHDHA